jgi:hypothetical protein
VTSDAAYSSSPAVPVSPWAALAAGFGLPGLGHLLIGERWRGMSIFVAVLSLFVLGIFIGGVRVIDPPGWQDGQRAPVSPRSSEWILTSRPVNAVLQRPWYIAQFLNGPINLVASYGSISAASSGYPKPTARLAEIGTLYCAAAGMLNLVAMLDAFGRAGGDGPKGTA